MDTEVKVSRPPQVTAAILSTCTCSSHLFPTCTRAKRFSSTNYTVVGPWWDKTCFPLTIQTLGLCRQDRLKNSSLYSSLHYFCLLLDTANKTYIRSVLYRTSAYTGAKQASRVPFWFRDLSRQNQNISSHFFVRVILYYFSGYLVSSLRMGFNSFMLFFYVSKFTF